MSKNGKIIGVAALVLAIAAVTFAVFSLKQAQAHARRYQELADAVSALSQSLDSGSGVASQVTYSFEDGKEEGSLGWPATKGLEGATSDAVAPLKDLAEKIIRQREALVEALVEKIAKPLDVPPGKAPNADVLNSVMEYENGMDGFIAYVRARAARDRNLQQKINTLLYSLEVRNKYAGEITNDGSFGSGDEQAFREAAKNLQNLRSNYSLLVNTVKSLNNALRGIALDGVEWRGPATASSLGTRGLSETETANLKGAVEKFQADIAQLKTQLARINVLEGEKAELEDQLAQANANARKWQDNYNTSESALRAIMGNITPTGKFCPDAITDRSQVREDLTGKVLVANGQYGHVLTNLTHGEVIPGLRFSVRRGDKFLGIVRITEVSPHNSLAVVEEGKATDIQAGDTLLLASETLQSVLNQND